MTDNSAPDRPAEFVQSLERGLAVIRAFSRDRPRLTLSDVARETGMTRAAARRFLITLESLGYVSSDGRLFSLRPSVLQLGYAYLSSFSLAEIAQDHLEKLAEALHESCSASVLDGEDIVYVARASTNRIMTIGLSVGARLPAYCTSMGRVLLAELDEAAIASYFATANLAARTDRTITDRDELRAELIRVREQGWCLLDQELEDGVRSVAIPVRDASGRVVAAINASAHATRVTIETLREEVLPRLQGCAVQIDLDLAGRQY
ncbi:MAG: IclR family transcriptional regulator [Actinomycetota bacterium]|nr:IclR family transcriptional regulator [Actinomycetota bacterium]